jgi:hypothetical protein
LPIVRRRSLFLAAPALALPAAARAQGASPPHAWLFGSWTGGIFPAVDTEGPGCFGNAVVIFTRDVIMRMANLDVAYRQRLIETVAPTPDGLEIRLLPAGGPGGRPLPESGFGCDGNPDLLRITRRGDDEIAFTNCIEFPSVLRRCRT